MTEELWTRSRSGSHAGRGFHYQDAVATELALRAWRGELAIRRIVPEGLDDTSLQLDQRWLHLQAKSRRTHRGDFALPELTPAWRHLAERLAADPTAHVALVLERPLPGAETGLDRVLADVASAELRTAVAAIGEVISLGDFLARTHVLVMPAAQMIGVQLLAERLALAPATCVAHHSILRAKLAHLADENGERDAADMAALTVGDIARLIDDVSEAVDPSALEEAVRKGICEFVDFTTPVADERFYSGVDVVVGHVVAGLPLERPELSDALAAGLLDWRVALAVGPSGSGKSTLIWLTAYEMRHRVRWYRVRRLREEDVPAVVRLVKGLEPTAGLPVGFVVDDLGRDDRVGFDLLVSELRERPDVLVLGACREEDLIIVRSAHQAAQVRPMLEEELAERIWRELRAREETAWPEWREPYEMSERLLLEYGHLLTAGTRLEETIAAQVERRMLEQRVLELDSLTLVATADAFGAEINATRLTAALDVSGTEMRSALARLVAEHLIAEHDGLLGGLHELRSRYVMRAVHLLPPPVSDSVRRVIDLLDAPALQPFLTRLLLEQAVGDKMAIDVVAARLARQPDPRTLAAALQALRLVGFWRMASRWRDVFVEEDASPTSVGVIAHFALQGGDYGFFPEPIQRAVARIREFEVVDLRALLLAKVAPQIPAALVAATDIKTAAIALAALGEVGQSVAIDPTTLARLADGASLEDLRLLLEAAYAASPELAIGLAEAIGGSAALLARLEKERPWVRDAHLSVNDEGRPTVEAEYAYVAESAQPNPHAAVVELAQYLAALAPSAEVAVCRAVDATGKTAGFGVPLADKAIDRRNLPSQAQVAWNRARGRAAIAAVAAMTHTEHLLAARDIVIQSTRLVRRASDAWVRGRKATQPLVLAATALAEAANKLKPPTIATEAAGPLDEGDLPFNDPASFVGTMIANNLLISLFKGQRVAPLIPQIIGQVDKLAEPEHWRLLDKPPLDDVATLRQALLDLLAVVAEGALGDRVTLIALRTAGKSGLAAAARIARQRAGARMQAVANRVGRKLADAGFTARVVRREGEVDSYRWPSDDFVVLVEVATIYDWQRSIETLADLCRPLLEDRVGFYIAPVRGGRVVASSAVQVINDVFPTEDLRDWRDLPLPLLDEQLGDIMRRGLAGLHEASGIIASIRRDEVHDDEIAALNAAAARAREALHYIDSLATQTGDQLLIEVSTTLSELGQMVDEEAAGLSRGQRVDRSESTAAWQRHCLPAWVATAMTSSSSKSSRPQLVSSGTSTARELGRASSTRWSSGDRSLAREVLHRTPAQRSGRELPLLPSGARLPTGSRCRAGRPAPPVPARR
jgi:hypothetical protein